MTKDAVYKKTYSSEIRRFITEGYAEEIPDSRKRDSRIWYLPHFGATSKNRPGKVRLVFDAAARHSGMSLHQKLLTGTDFLKSLPAVIMRFRRGAIRIKGHIRDMFLKVVIRGNDRNAQQLLWRENQYVNPKIYRMRSMIFGAAWSPCCALYVKDKNAREFAELFPEAAAALINSYYMDDWLESIDIAKRGIVLACQVSKIKSATGFEMHC